MNLTSILAQLYQRCRYPSTPPTATTTRLTAHINRVHSDVLTMPELLRLRDDVIPITAPANKARTGLPPVVERIIAITDRTNNVKLEQVPLTELRLNDPSQAFTQGFPVRYAVVGNQSVQIQPSAATGLWIVSSDAADTTQKVFIESMVTGGYPANVITAGTSLNGLTRVAIGALTTHIEIMNFFLDLPAAGYVSLYDAAVAGNELARIPIGDTFSRYLSVEWWPIQTQDTTEYLDFTRRVFDLVKGTDEPLLPRDFHDTIVDGALELEYLFMGDIRVADAHAAFTKDKADLISWVMTDQDRIASLRPTNIGWNRLGPQYPSQRWPY